MDFILIYHWEIFIAIEVLSFICLLLFGMFRYFFGKHQFSLIFIFSFLLLLLIEALLGLYVYRQTGEISTFLIIITVFLVYACTFGVVDFRRLDIWMRDKIGKLRGVDLLTEKDYRIMERNRNPNYLAKKYRISSLIHLVIFVIGQSIFWSMGTDSLHEVKDYITDLSWVEEGTAEDSPYPNDIIYGIGVIWGIAFIVDFIYSWSYTLFPSKKE
ncbi:hypothetical protein [Oceanobacillus massiliensis]|uniref:hypothetical protein n=1 Tax=Oceanobacillus massiliensis TaxID=1465765 RepID=UPI000289BEAD|nr:hypothetical protein [Oceanobacillus massiliensis]